MNLGDGTAGEGPALPLPRGSGSGSADLASGGPVEPAPLTAHAGSRSGRSDRSGTTALFDDDGVAPPWLRMPASGAAGPLRSGCGTLRRTTSSVTGSSAVGSSTLGSSTVGPSATDSSAGGSLAGRSSSSGSSSGSSAGGSSAGRSSGGSAATDPSAAREPSEPGNRPRTGRVTELAVRRARTAPAPGPYALRPAPRSARPRVVEEPGILGLSRLTRGRVGSRLFTLFFVAVFALIAVQTVWAILYG